MRLVDGRRDIKPWEIPHDGENKPMIKPRWGPILRRVHALLDEGVLEALSDRELVDRFATTGTESAERAFAALVDRHGPMVLRVCRGVLGDEHAAQDAFQATFLVLVRRANSLWVGESIAPWLHQVAVRTSSSARNAAARRRFHENRAAGQGRPDVDAPPLDEVGPILHQEIDRLPERYHTAVVLCYLEGLTHEQAAERLGCPVGTVRSRLATGRERLRRRLTLRGMAPGRDLAGPSTWTEEPGPVVPAALVDAAIRNAALRAGVTAGGKVPAAVASLAARELRNMMLSRLRYWALGLLLVIGGGSLGAIAIAQRAGESGRPDSPKGQPGKEAPPPRADRRFLEARIATAREILDRDLERFRMITGLDVMGAGQADQIPAWSRRLMGDRLRLADTPADRLDAIREHRNRMTLFERIMRAYNESGQGKISDALRVRYYRIEADQLLFEAGVDPEKEAPAVYPEKSGTRPAAPRSPSSGAPR